jgi:hypothetical protein
MGILDSISHDSKISALAKVIFDFIIEEVDKAE